MSLFEINWLIAMEETGKYPEWQRNMDMEEGCLKFYMTFFKILRSNFSEI